MDNDTQNERQSLWSETKRPDPAAQLPPEALRFVDPLDKIDRHSEADEQRMKLAIAAAAVGICSVVTFPLKFLPICLGVIAVLLGIRTDRYADCQKPAKIAVITGIIGIAAAVLNLTLFPVLFKMLEGFGNGLVPKDLS